MLQDALRYALMLSGFLGILLGIYFFLSASSGYLTFIIIKRPVSGEQLAKIRRILMPNPQQLPVQND